MKNVKRISDVVLHKKVLMGLGLLSTVVLLSSCDIDNNLPKSIIACTNVGLGTADTYVSQYDTKLGCVTDAISAIKDNFVRGCIENNIDSKKDLAKKLSSGPELSDAEIKDIDGLAKECLYYKEKEKPSNESSTPIFDSFIGSTAGSFLGNYLSDSLFRSRMDNSNGGTKSIYDNYNNNGTSTTTKSNVSTTDNVKATTDSYKANTWNVKEMKSTSSTKTNWSLGKSGTSWGKSSSAGGSSSLG